VINSSFIYEILTEYANEVEEFSYELACLAARDNQLNGRGAFSDVEGIILYCLIRHFKPQLFFEISPDTGMSTNYILQAVGKNGSGKVIGFELDEKKQQGTLKPTLQVIKENAVTPSFIDKHYELVIGDATKTCCTYTYGKPDAVLIDSCHDSWFAEWYLTNLLPYVKTFSVIQDISYTHRLEGSTEAQTVIRYLEHENTNRILLDNFRGWIEVNSKHYPIRNVLTNSILLAGNEEKCDDKDEFPDIGSYDIALSDQSILSDVQHRQRLLKASMPGGTSQFAPRYLAKVLPFETNPFLQRKITDAMFGSLEFSTSKEKDFRYCLMTLLKHRKKLRENGLLLVLLRLVIRRPWFTVKAISYWLKYRLLDRKN
jgi:predicted O-methyltransferase YrrM